MITINIYHYARRIFCGVEGKVPHEVNLTRTQWKIFMLLAVAPRTMEEICIVHNDVTETAMYSHIGNIKNRFRVDPFHNNYKGTYSIDNNVKINNYE